MVARRGPIVARLLAVLGGVGASAISIELYLRAFAPVEYRQVPDVPGGDYADLLHRASSLKGLEYELASNVDMVGPVDGVRMRTNSHGMRGPEVALEKAPGVVRIAVVGDSFTFGKGVEDEECFPFVMEEMLNGGSAGNVRYEVLNFGVSGYSSRDEAIVLEERVLRFGPDLVLVGYVFNDPAAHPEWGLHLYFHETEWWERFHVTRLIAYHWEESRVSRYSSHFEYLHSDEEPHWQTVLDAFDRMQRVVEAAGVPLAVAIFPSFSLSQPWSVSSHPRIREKVANAARGRGFTVHDVAEDLMRVASDPREVMLDAGGHANAYGNRVIAEQIAAFLIRRYGPTLRWQPK